MSIYDCIDRLEPNNNSLVFIMKIQAQLHILFAVENLEKIASVLTIHVNVIGNKFKLYTLTY